MKQKTIKACKAWAIIDKKGEITKDIWDYYYITSKKSLAKLGCRYNEKVVRVEIKILNNK